MPKRKGIFDWDYYVQTAAQRPEKLQQELPERFRETVHNLIALMAKTFKLIDDKQMDITYCNIIINKVNRYHSQYWNLMEKDDEGNDYKYPNLMDEIEMDRFAHDVADFRSSLEEWIESQKQPLNKKDTKDGK